MVRLKYSRVEVVESADQLENRVAAEALKYFGILDGIEIATFSDFPESAGLGGSSSFCVALVCALRSKLGLSSSKEEIYLDAYNIERIKAGQPGGVQDQMFASFGGSWSTTLGYSCIPTLVPIDVSALLPRLRLVYTRSHRTNLNIANEQISDVQTQSTKTLDSLRDIKSLGLEIESRIRAGEIDGLGDLFHTHWLSKKSRSSLISSENLDNLYQQALRLGATGGKLLGLGGGGYFLFFVPEGCSLEPLSPISIGVDFKGVQVVYMNGESN